MRRHGAHDIGEGLDLRLVAVQQLERLPVVRADTHLEPHLAGDGIVDHPAHLEAGHLAAEHAVLLDRCGAARLDQLDEDAVVGRHCRGFDQWLGHGGLHGATGQMGHRDRHRERHGTAGQYASACGCQDMNAASLTSHRPCERTAQATLGLLGEQDPRHTVGGHHGRTTAEADRRVDCNDALICHQRRQLHAHQRCSAGGIEGGRHHGAGYRRAHERPAPTPHTRTPPTPTPHPRQPHPLANPAPRHATLVAFSDGGVRRWLQEVG